jgi:hypothetical protein
VIIRWAPFSIALREQVAFVFERLYGTSELHTSKDGFTFLRPPRSADEVSKGDWSHFDQVLVVFSFVCFACMKTSTLR